MRFAGTMILMHLIEAATTNHRGRKRQRERLQKVINAGQAQYRPTTFSGYHNGLRENADEWDRIWAGQDR